MSWRAGLVSAGWGRAGLALAALFAICGIARAAPPEPRAGLQLPFKIVSVTPDAVLSSAMQRTHGWTGADGAHSHALGRGFALWLFGDTFVGDVVDGRRDKNSVMVHNSAAWWKDGAFRFFPQRTDLLRPRDDPASWYWPGDGAIVNGRLLLFCMRVRATKGGDFGFGFDWYGMDMLDVDNPEDEPPRWHVASQVPAPSRDGILPGAACSTDERFVYAYGIRPADRERRLFVARRSLEGADWTWWCDPADWRADGVPAALFDDAAPEMSVTRAAGGWLAVYSPHGLSADVALRWAPSPHGPWTPATVVYRAPEAARKLLVYGARAHPEMGTENEIVLSYNCNAADEATLMRDASAYAPRFVRMRIAPVRTTENMGSQLQLVDR